MKKIRHLLAILMTVTMITSGGGMDGFAALTYAAEDQEAPAVTQEQEVSEGDAVNPSESDADEPIADIEAEADDSAMSDEAELVLKTLKASKVKLEGLMPEDAKATATDASNTKAVKKLASKEETTLAAYDITIQSDGAEYQPDADNPILVQISNKAIKEDSDLTIWHIKDNGKKEQIEDFELSNGKVTFEATGFSVYAIVEGPELLKPGEEFTLSLANGKYFKNTVSGGVFQTTTNESQASIWYLENVPESDSLFYLCTDVGGVKKYVKNTSSSSNNVELVAEGGSPFEISRADTVNKYYFKLSGVNKWLQWSNGGGGIRFWGDNNNANNSQIILEYTDYTPATIDLDGKTFGIAYHDGSISAAGMMAEGSGNKLNAMDLQVRPDVLNSTGVLLVANDSEVTEWTFYAAGEGKYYITAQVGGETKYLTMDGTVLTLVSNPDPEKSAFTPSSGSGPYTGKYQFSIGTYSLTLSGGTASGGFVGVNKENKGYSWLNLVEKSEQLDDDDFTIYTAAKKSISEKDPNNSNVGHYVITDGTQVVLYTRIWNPNTLTYDFYAVNHDGKLLPCYDSGDIIQWYGSQINTALWTLTEHYEGGEPNGYYELQNTYSEKYIAPKLDGQILQNGTIGINLAGRENGDAYSTIAAWDDPHYAYAALKVENGRVVSCPLDEADDFYFAIIEDVSADKLTTVSTVDNNEYGISLKMSNYKYQGYYINKDGYKGNTFRQALQTVLLGGLNTDEANMVKRNLEGGYPVSRKGSIGGDASMRKLFETTSYTAPGEGGKDAGTTTVDANHLFLKSIYDESGYFQFDSTQNFAWLQDDNNFKVYDQLVTSDKHDRDSMRHGQFFPYNKIENENGEPCYQYSTKFFNTTDTSMNELPDTDPRKGEKLYNIPKGQPNDNRDPDPDAVDYFFGMEMTASFTQTPSGKDAWGHDIIFEFSGDDDMWFFVDDVLVLDMGGIHSAMRGKVNFRTGQVIGRGGNQTTLRECFRLAYIEKNPSATTDEINNYLNALFVDNGEGQYIFKDYTTHTMKMFYMERGAGSSNLYMRLNLTAVKEGHALLSKEISGADKQDFRNVEYPFQIWYKENEGDEFKRLKSNSGDSSVTYRGRGGKVKYADSYTADGVEYKDVFFLKLGESADIEFPKETYQYKIVECGVDTRIYDNVTVNNGTEAVTDNPGGQHSKTYTTTEATTANRPIVIFNNHVNDLSHTLTITKVLWDAEGNELSSEQDPTLFKYRLSLANEGGELKQAYMHPYYVKGPHGLYCKRSGDNFAEIAGCGTFEELSALIANHTVLTREVKFATSPNGAIDSIPAGYSVEIRDLVVGTQYKVLEREDEIPVGYTCKGYSDVSKEADPSGAYSAGSIPAEGHDPQVWVTNKRGWGIHAEKLWSDDDFVDSHEEFPFFAVFIKRDGAFEYVPDTVRQLDKNNYTNYFFENLEDDVTFDQYVVREVRSDAGIPVPVNRNNAPDSEDFVRLAAVPIGESASSEFKYIPTYLQGEPEGAVNHIRNDKVTNTRTGGIKIIKTDMDGEPLQGAKFKLIKKGTGGTDDITIGTFTSSELGYVTTAYLKEGATYLGDGTYELTEETSPRGYEILADTITIQVNNNQYHIDPGTGYTYDGSKAIPLLTIKNKPFKLQAVKVDSVNPNTKLYGAKFDLYKGIKVTSQGTTRIRKDYYPMEGYTDLESDVNGVISGVNQELAPGTYYLVETAPPERYKKLDKDVRFTISNEGKVTVDTDDNNGTQFVGSLSKDTKEDSTDYIIKVPNTRDVNTLSVVKQVAGSFADPDDEFDFTVDSLTQDKDYEYQRYTSTDGSNWDAETGTGASGVLHANAEGKIPFKLKHNEKIVIVLPEVTSVKVAEAESDYTPSYAINDGQIRPCSSPVHIPMNNDNMTVTFTNTKGQIAPTGYSSYLWPLIWMLLLGMFMWTAMTYMRKRRSLDGFAMEAAGIDSYDEET